MKKVLSAILAAATLSTASPSSAQEGNNWYAGLQLGAAFNRTKFTLTRKGTTGTKNKSKTSMPVGLQAGWMSNTPNDIFWALEVGAFYDFNSESKVQHKKKWLKLKKRWGIELMPKLGYQFNEEWAAYGLVGITATSFKLSTPLGNTTKSVAGIAPGCGVMYKVDSQWSTNLEYKYQIHQKIDKSYNDQLGQPSAKAEPRAHVITWKLNYAFA